jgi:hypothetical protein
LGGTFTRTPGGTTIIVADQPRLSGGGGGSVIPCPFEVTDASEETTLKVQIAWGLIYQKLPTGMYPDNKPPLRMTVTENCYVYSKIVFNTNTLIPTSVSFSIESDIAENTSNTQYNLIARVFIDPDADPPVISQIKNVCQQPFPSPCALAPG